MNVDKGPDPKLSIPRDGAAAVASPTIMQVKQKIRNVKNHNSQPITKSVDQYESEDRAMKKKKSQPKKMSDDAEENKAQAA